MVARSILCVAVLFGSLAAVAGAGTAQAQQPDCRYFRVQANGLNIAKEPKGDSVFIDMLDKNDVVCVTRNQKVGDRDWGFIAHKVEKPDQHKAVEGWATMRSLQPATPEELAAVRGIAAAPPPPPVAAAAPSQDDVLKYTAPITFGPFPVNGHSIEELITGTPLFPPIEGLDDSVWKKTCSNCHKWDQRTLCEQGTSYAKNPKASLRISHPYGGGVFQLALMRWAKSGCQ
jgi:hypothetical protein